RMYRMAAPAAVPAPKPVSQSITVTAEAAAVSAYAKSNDGAAPIEVTVRSDFRSTAFWKPDVVTDASGVAKVSFKYPEALTTWRATARVTTPGTHARHPT